MKVSDISTNTEAKGTLFNNTRIGHDMVQVAVSIAAVEEQKMLKFVNDHWQVFNEE
jgi:hypothetical protein